MSSIVESIGTLRLVPVIALDRAEHAVALGETLMAAGLPCAEVTLRTPAAIETLKAMAAIPDLLLGAGTVHRVEQAQQAVDAGAQFIVTPGLSARVVQWCLDTQVTVIPGCATPTDLEVALEMGLELVKFFPAEALGGTAMLRALSAPYAELSFLPTGGIHAGNVADYLALPCVHAVGGSWMVRREWLAAGDFSKVRQVTAEAVSICRQA